MRFGHAILLIALGTAPSVVASVAGQTPSAPQSVINPATGQAMTLDQLTSGLQNIDRMLELEAGRGFLTIKEEGNRSRIEAMSKEEAVKMFTEDTFTGEREGVDLPKQIQDMRRKSNALKGILNDQRKRYQDMIDTLKMQDEFIYEGQPVQQPPPPSTITDAGTFPVGPDARGSSMGESLPASVLAGLAKPSSSEFQPMPVDPQPATVAAAAPARPPRPKMSAEQIGQLAGAFGNLIAGIRGNSPRGNPYGGTVTGAPIPSYAPPTTTYAAPAAGGSGWAGTYDLDGFGRVVVTGEGASLGGQWTSTDNNHVTRVGGCNVVGNQAQCATAGSFRDPVLVDVDYRGTLTVTLNGATISGTHTITQATQSWHTDPFVFPLREGSVIPVTMTRVN